jgi:hypothetical protein
MQIKLIIQTRRPREKDRNVTIDGDIIEVVEDFAYLGWNTHKGGDKFYVITRRINLVNKTCFSLLHIFKFKCGFQNDIEHKILERYAMDKQGLRDYIQKAVVP